MEIKFKVEYDIEEDILMIYSDKSLTKESIEVAEDIIIDVDKNNKLTGIEMLYASQFFNTLNKVITKKMLSEIKNINLKTINYRNLLIITLVFDYKGSIIEEKLPAFSINQFESPLVAAV